jgi:hypothetical protein
MAEAFKPRFVDLVRNYTSTTGTGNFVPGAAVAGYRSFASAIQPGEGFYYSAIGIDKPDEFEVGRGTMQADGTISRDASGGTLTNFSDGTKTLALVAAAEWYEGVQAGSAGALSAAETRDVLAGLSDTSKPAMLHESGRSGLFVFDPADRSAEVGADTAQGVYVAPASDPSGKSGAWVRRDKGVLEARWFGAAGDGLADDTAAIKAAIAYVESLGGGVVRLGSGTFAVSDYLPIVGDDVTLDARDATVTSAMNVVNAIFYMGGARARILGGTWKLTAGVDKPYFFEVDGLNGEIDGANLVKEPEAGGYHGYLRASTDGFVMRNCRTKGSNGIYCEGSNCAFLSNSFVGRVTGGDDAIAIKAISGSARNIRIVGNSFENLAYFCSVGSEIGVLNVDDPSYSRGVYNVVVAGNCGVACSGLLFVKPGAISNYDYRDGTVEGVVLSDNLLRDETGAKFTRGVAITAARGARVRNVTGKNNLIIARTVDDGGRHVGALDIYIPDYSALSTARAPAISDIDVSVEFRDPYDGAEAGTAGVPGLPTSNIASVERESPSYGTLSDIVVDVSGTGCLMSGISIHNCPDDAVSIHRAILNDIVTDGSAIFGGIQYDSRIKVGDEVSITMAAGTSVKPYRPDAGSTAAIVSNFDVVCLGSTIPAGSKSGRITFWSPARNAFAHRVEVVNATNINKSGDDTNYTQHEIRNGDGVGAILSVSSRLTGGQALPMNQFNRIYDATDLTSTYFNDCFYTRGQRMNYTKNDFGTGNALTNPFLRVHWAPY